MASHSVNLRVAVRSSIQAVNMFSRILEIFVIFLIAASHVESAPAVNKLPRQFLPALPGFIPVYIRPGDTPLEDINPDLAEAFNSYAQKHARLSFGRANSVRDQGKIHVHIDDSHNIDNVEDLDLNVVTVATKPPGLVEAHHIQKIPRI